MKGIRMKKTKYLLIISVFLFFLFTSKAVCASEYDIIQSPVASEIVYGAPLFQSELIGGSSSEEGVFVWKNEDVILDAGVYTEKVLFIPSNDELNHMEIDVEITVKPRKIFVTFEKELKKIFDSSNKIELPAYVVKGALNEEVYVVGNLKGELESAFVGENINVTLSGIELDGIKKNNYYLDLDGFTATIYPKAIEMFGEIKNKVEFIDDMYVPMNSIIHLESCDAEFTLPDYKYIESYNIVLKNGEQIVDIDGKIKVKIKLDDAKLTGDKIALFNYYNNEYRKIDYVYEDGYLIYESDGLGSLVVFETVANYSWLVMIIVLAVLTVLCILLFVKKKPKTRIKKKINKYKSLKRSRDYGN